MIKILQIGMTNSLGGIEAYLINYYRKINQKKVLFDFLNIYSDNICFRDEIIELGGKIIDLPSYYKHPIRYIREVKRIIIAGNYDIIHCNMSSSTMLFPLIAAKMAGAKVIISHAHNNSSDKGIIKSIIHNINKHFLPILANYYFACSISAAEWFFNKKIIDSNRFYLINNPVDTENFAFNNEVRIKKRKELNIKEGMTVIGHVGRFVKVKNHVFLIDVFSEYLKLNRDSLLLLIGVGELQAEIKNKVKQLEIDDKVYFLNNRNDVGELMQAMDIFVFPSLYEGLGMVLVEAQTSGLPILASHNMPKEVEINSNFYRKKILDGAKDWAVFIDKMNKSRCKKINTSNFDINECVKRLVDIYTKISGSGGKDENDKDK